jgi:thioredoxin 1
MKKLVFLLFASSIFVVNQAYAIVGSVTHINSIEQFDTEISSGLVVADFGTNWCGPCKQMARIIADLAREMQQIHFLKIDTDALSALAARYNITNIPTFIFFKNGKLVFRCTGSRNKNNFKQEISSRLLL